MNRKPQGLEMSKAIVGFLQYKNIPRHISLDGNVGSRLLCLCRFFTWHISHLLAGTTPSATN